MRDSLFFTAKYNSLIYTNVLYTFDICLQIYLDQHFSIALFQLAFFITTLQEYTEIYYKNSSLYIFSHIYIMHTWAFGINKILSQPPSTIILKKTKAFICFQNVEIDLKDMQMFFTEITYEAYIILESNLLLDLDFNNFSELTYSGFAKYKNINNQVKGINFAQLANDPELKSLSMVLINYILFRSKLKIKFINQNKK